MCDLRYAAKMEHEGAAMYDAAAALRDAMIELGLACDGGKDSLSMAAAAGGEVSILLACLAVGRSQALPVISHKGISLLDTFMSYCAGNSHICLIELLC